MHVFFAVFNALCLSLSTSRPLLFIKCNVHSLYCSSFFCISRHSLGKENQIIIWPLLGSIQVKHWRSYPLTFPELQGRRSR